MRLVKQTVTAAIVAVVAADVAGITLTRPAAGQVPVAYSAPRLEVRAGSGSGNSVSSLLGGSLFLSDAGVFTASASILDEPGLGYVYGTVGGGGTVVATASTVRAYAVTGDRGLVYLGGSNSPAGGYYTSRGGPATLLTASTGGTRTQDLGTAMLDAGGTTLRIVQDTFSNDNDALRTIDVASGAGTTYFHQSDAGFSQGFTGVDFNAAGRASLTGGGTQVLRVESDGSFAILAATTGSPSSDFLDIINGTTINAGGNVAFQGRLRDVGFNDGIFVSAGPNDLRNIVTENTAIDGLVITDLNASTPDLNDLGNVVFKGTVGGVSRVLVGDGQNLTIAASVGDGVRLPNGTTATISRFNANPRLNNDNTVAFFAEFANGGSGLLTVSVPEPGAGTLLLVTSAVVTLRRRRFV